MSHGITGYFASERLEPCAGKLACTVLRGADSSNAVSLLDFSFIGNQYRIVTPDSEYFIDLLFYHRKLQSLVALELKTTKFKAEYAGKMNFYLNLLDDFVKEPHENPSIGIILCSERSKFDVEYALRGIDKPVGVAGYELTRDIPDKLKDALPAPEELEEKILFELELDKDHK